MRRRALLAAVPGVVLASAGCLGSGDPAARLASISLKNDRDEAYDVAVAVDDGDETVFSDEYRLGTDPETAAVLLEDPVDGPGAYAVRATMDGREMTVDATDFVEGEETCVAVEFVLLNNGSTDWSTKSMQRC